MTCGLQKGQPAVSSAFGGGAGRLSVPGSFSALRPNAILLVRPEIGLIRTSMCLSATSPDGSISFAVIIRVSKDRELIVLHVILTERLKRGIRGDCIPITCPRQKTNRCLSPNERCTTHRYIASGLNQRPCEKKEFGGSRSFFGLCYRRGDVLRASLPLSLRPALSGTPD